MREIKVVEVEHLAHSLAKKYLTWNEPIPDFSTRYPGILESCLRTTFQTFDGKDLYPTFLDKAANLFYLMNKNHPFLNGNKRIAVTTLIVFLSLNGRWLAVSAEALYQIAMDVAQSKPQYKDAVVREIVHFLRAGVRKE